MLTISNLCRSFGAQTVFEQAHWSVPHAARVGLVGPNGSGKSTLLRMIAGLEVPDSGAVVVPKETTVGYLPQEVLGVSGRTIMEESLDAFAAARTLERECRRLEASMADTPPDAPGYGDLMDAYAQARERWDAVESYDHESQAATVLAGLGFRPEDFTRDAGEFSGGWQMRLALAKLLLRRPGILLLDEPTNHLDLEARNWLEEFVRAYPHTVIAVAHDRYFLDVTVEGITEIARGRLVNYPHTTYSRYLHEREERREREVEAYRLQQEEIARIEAFISRFRYQASKAALVQSRIKQLEKIERLPAPEGGPAAVYFRFPPCQRSGRLVLKLNGAVKRYRDLTVYDGIDLALERGRKVALVGPNGAGKTTLLKMLAAVEPLTSGERRIGHNVTLGYFAQDQGDVLDPERTVLAETTAAAPYDMAPRVRELLGAFLFGGDSVYKKIKVLSGGERNRLALAKLLLQASNVLLLDEPTNHLDLSAKEVLLNALRNYTGTLVLVAHDRYLLDELPDEVIEVGAGHATRYLGNYEDYLRQKAAGATGGPPPRTTAEPVPRKEANERAAAGKASPSDREAARRAAGREARRQRDRARLEQAIEEREAELAGVTAVINDPDFYRSHDRPQSVLSEYARLKKEIDTSYTKLEKLERQA